MTVLELKPLLVHKANSRDVLNLSLTWNIPTCLDDDHFKRGRKKAVTSVGPPSPSGGQSLCPCMSTLHLSLFSKGQAEALSPTTGLYYLRDNNSFCTGSWGAAGTGLKQQASIFLMSQIHNKVWFRGTVPSQSRPSSPQLSHLLWQSSCALIRRLSREAQSSGENGEESALLKRVLPPGLRSGVAYSL